MVTKRYLLPALFILLCGLLIIKAAFPGEQACILEQVENLRAVVSKDADETEMETGIREKKLCGMVVSPCRIESAVYGITKTFAPDEIGPSVIAARRPFRRIEVDIKDLHVADLSPDRAVVRFTASICLAPHDGPPVNDTHEVVCRARKDHGRWRFSDIRTVNVLER